MHYGGGLAGADDGGEGANGGDGLSQIGVPPPLVELVDHGEIGIGGGVGGGGGGVGGDDGGLGLSKPLVADDAEVRHSVLVVRRYVAILH